MNTKTQIYYVKSILLIFFQLISVSLYASEEPMKIKELSQLEKEYKESPMNHEVNYEYCGSLVSHKKYNLALKVCTIAIETGNKNTLSWSYLNRGIAYYSLGKLVQSKKDKQLSKEHGMPTWLLNDFLSYEKQSNK